jgi:hypothetical protein
VRQWFDEHASKSTADVDPQVVVLLHGIHNDEGGVEQRRAELADANIRMEFPTTNRWKPTEVGRRR